MISESLSMEKEVVRVWFCNRRQKEKRIFCPVATLPMKSHNFSTRTVSPSPANRACTSQSQDHHWQFGSILFGSIIVLVVVVSVSKMKCEMICPCVEIFLCSCYHHRIYNARHGKTKSSGYGIITLISDFTVLQIS